jgi:hypothetical protein
VVRGLPIDARSEGTGSAEDGEDSGMRRCPNPACRRFLRWEDRLYGICWRCEWLLDVAVPQDGENVGTVERVAS